MKKYDYLIVGAGIFGAIFAYEAKNKGKKCLVIDKRKHIEEMLRQLKSEKRELEKLGGKI